MNKTMKAPRRLMDMDDCQEKKQRQFENTVLLITVDCEIKLKQKLGFTIVIHRLIFILYIRAPQCVCHNAKPTFFLAPTKSIQRVGEATGGFCPTGLHIGSDWLCGFFLKSCFDSHSARLTTVFWFKNMEPFPYPVKLNCAPITEILVCFFMGF